MVAASVTKHWFGQPVFYAPKTTLNNITKLIEEHLNVLMGKSVSKTQLNSP